MRNKAEKLYEETMIKINNGQRVPLLKAIRMKCLDCTCFQENEVRLCPSEDCVLWKFRMGKNPIKRKMTEEQRKVISERFKKSILAKTKK